MMSAAAFEYEEHEPPLHLRFRTLQDLLQEYTPEYPLLDGETVKFEIDGIDPGFVANPE
jgi:hypothetical protein